MPDPVPFPFPAPGISFSVLLQGARQGSGQAMSSDFLSPCLPTGAKILPELFSLSWQHAAPLWDLLVILHWVEIRAIVFHFLSPGHREHLVAFLISFVLPRPTSPHFYHYYPILSCLLITAMAFNWSFCFYSYFPCMSYQLLCNKLSQNIMAKTIIIHCYTVSVKRNCHWAGCLWLTVSREVAAHLWVRAAITAT